MQLDRRAQGDVLILKVLQSRLDLEGAPAMKQVLREAIDGGSLRIVLDLEAVTFLDSSGLGAIISGLKALAGRGTLVLSGARGNVQDTLRLTRMDRVFLLYPSEAEAVAALSK